jgi:hypothetical protein
MFHRSEAPPNWPDDVIAQWLLKLTTVARGPKAGRWSAIRMFVKASSSTFVGYRSSNATLHLEPSKSLVL